MFLLMGWIYEIIHSLGSKSYFKNSILMKTSLITLNQQLLLVSFFLLFFSHYIHQSNIVLYIFISLICVPYLPYPSTQQEIRSMNVGALSIC